MSRNPRKISSQHSGVKLLPSLGRAPTPPKDSTNHLTSPYFGLPLHVSSTDSSRAVQRISVTRNLSVKSSNGKSQGKRQNQSILNFFGRQTDKRPSSETPAGDS